MNSNRIDGMRLVAKNLRMEGQGSRAAAVTELCDALERTQRLLAKATRESKEMPAALRLKIEAELEGFRASEQGDGSFVEARPPVMDPERDDVLYP